MTMRILAWLLILMMAVAPMAAAQDDENEAPEQGETQDAADDAGPAEDAADAAEEDAANETEGDDESREVSVSVSDTEVEFELEREDVASEDRIVIRFDTSDAGFEVAFEAESGNNETAQRLEAWLHQLVEYVDANANGMYDEGEELVSGFDLSSSSDDALLNETQGEVAWRPLVHEEITSATGVPGHKIEARADFGENAVFGLDIYAFGDFTSVGDAAVAPTEVKFDILIQNYPYLRNDTALAVLAETEAASEFETDHEDVDADEQGVAATSVVGDKLVSLIFAWKEVVRVDGVDRPVGSTLLSDEQHSETTNESAEHEVEQLIVLSYPRGTDILHDPTTGVSYTSASAGGDTPTNGSPSDGSPTDGSPTDGTGGAAPEAGNDTPGFGVALVAAAAGVASALLVRRKQE